MNNQVTIAPDELGNVIRVSKNNSDYGHVRLTQDRVIITVNGWVKNSNVSALLHGTVEDLQIIGIADKETLPGKIIIRESVDPFSKNDPDRDLKIAGETGVICCSHGEPIYRKSFYDPSGTQEDDLVPHTNGDAIREAQALSSPNSDGIKKKAEEISKQQLEDIKKNINEEVTNETTEEVTEEVTKDETLEEVTAPQEEVVEEVDDSFEL